MLSSKARFLLLLAFLPFYLLLEGCGPRLEKPAPVVTPAPVKKPSVAKPLSSLKIGLLVPLSGPSRGLGGSLQNAAELAFFEKGHEGIELIIEDTLGTPEGAKLATQKALTQGCRLIIGPVFSASVQESRLLTASSQTPLLSFTNDKKAASPHTFILGFDPWEQVDRVLSFAEKRGKKTSLAFVPDNEYGHLIELALRQRESLGVLKVVHLEKYDPENPAQFSKTRFPKADLLLIAEGGQNLSQVLSTLLYHENKLDTYQLIGTGQWDSPSVRANHSLTGGWFASPDPQSRAAFEKSFQETYGYRPPRLATLAYDAVSMVSALSKNASQDPFSLQALTQERGFMGLDGPFRLKKDGTVQRGLAVLESHPEGFQVIDFMPKKF